jgi:hypothetical protein
VPRRATPLTDFDQIHVSAIELATLFGISDKELTKLAMCPGFPTPKYSREWLYPLGSAVTAYTQYQRREQTQAQREYLVARTRAQTATAAKKELEVNVRAGVLIEKQKVIRALTIVCATAECCLNQGR